MKHFLKILTISLAFYSCQGNSVQKFQISGIWIGDSVQNVYKGEKINTLPYRVRLVFKRDSVLWGQSEEAYDEFPFLIKDNYLIINGEKMKVVELTSNRLVLQRNIKKNLTDVGYFHRLSE